MIEQDYSEFTEESHDLTTKIIPTSYGDIYSITAGVPGQPLILVVHGSGPSNTCQNFAWLLHQYLVRVSFVKKFYMVAIDCPGYGQSKGKKQSIRNYPLLIFRQILQFLDYKHFFAMYGRSQGGAAILNAIYEDPNISEFLVMDRSVCGNIQRFNKFKVPALLAYDIEDEGHPIEQGELLYKEMANAQFYTYRSSEHPYWVPDNIWNKMLSFFDKYGKDKVERKAHIKCQSDKKSKSYSKLRSNSNGKKVKKYILVQRYNKLLKNNTNQSHLLEVRENQRSRSVAPRVKKPVVETVVPEQKPELQVKPALIKEEESQLSNFEEQQERRVVIEASFFERGIRFRPKPKVEEEKIEQIPQPQQIIEVEEPSDESSANISEIDDGKKCSICYQVLYRPLTTNCGHTYCSKCLLQSLLVSQKCPICRAVVTKRTQNKDLQHQIEEQMSQKEISRRQDEFKQFDKVLKNIVYVEIGNTSRQLETKQSNFTKTQKKYVWQLFVKQPRYFPIQEVTFNINMSNTNAKPIRIRNAPFSFESRGTFSFRCQVTVKLKNKDYPELFSVYRIDIEPGCHSKKIPLKKKCHMK